MKEAVIERYFIEKVKKAGGKALKFNSTSMVGLPDRIILMPCGRIMFVELKATDKKPRYTQISAHKMLQALGFKVYVIDSKLKVDEFINEVAI